MKIVRIFVSEERNSSNGLYAIRYADQELSAYRRLFEDWTDPSPLINFFEDNLYELQNGFWGNISIGDAVSQTIEDAYNFREALLSCSKGGIGQLQHIFQPLYNHEYRLTTLQKSKGKFRRSWLRIYAIRLDNNCFIITGGAIKLTFNMEPAYLQEELKKLSRVKAFLQENSITAMEHLKFYKNE